MTTPNPAVYQVEAPAQYGPNILQLNFQLDEIRRYYEVEQVPIP